MAKKLYGILSFVGISGGLCTVSGQQPLQATKPYPSNTSLSQTLADHASLLSKDSWSEENKGKGHSCCDKLQNARLLRIKGGCD
eukprot:scaffold312432_cov17-Tisochrysis_lutea.AAC.2